MLRLITLILLLASNTLAAQNYSQINWGSSIPLSASQPSAVLNDSLISLSYADGNFRQAIFRSFDRSGTLLDSNLVELDTSFFGVFFF